MKCPSSICHPFYGLVHPGDYYQFLIAREAWSRAPVSLVEVVVSETVACQIAVVDLTVDGVTHWPSTGAIAGDLLKRVVFSDEPIPTRDDSVIELTIESRSHVSLGVNGFIRVRLEDHPSEEITLEHHRRNSERMKKFAKQYSGDGDD